MNKKFYFIAGLPRSGSTVLSSILNQNPKFYSGPSSPVISTMFSVEDHLLNNELFNNYPKPTQAKQIITSIPFQFYSDRSEPIIFDKNRAWPARIPYIEGYIQQRAKIICPIRSTKEIFASFIALIRRNPYKEGQLKINFIDEQLVKLNIPLNDYNRCDFLASKQGILGQSINALFEAFNQKLSDRILLINYQNLMENSKNTMNKIYEFLGEDEYEHDFSNIINKNQENDLSIYGLDDMHKVNKVLKKSSIIPEQILSEQILNLAENVDKWQKAINTFK